MNYSVPGHWPGSRHRTKAKHRASTTRDANLHYDAARHSPRGRRPFQLVCVGGVEDRPCHESLHAVWEDRHVFLHENVTIWSEIQCKLHIHPPLNKRRTADATFVTEWRYKLLRWTWSGFRVTLCFSRHFLRHEAHAYQQPNASCYRAKTSRICASVSRFWPSKDKPGCRP